MPMTVRHERDDVYRVEVTGLLRSSEFEHCQGVLRAEIDRVGPVRLLFVLDAFDGWEPQRRLARPVASTSNTATRSSGSPSSATSVASESLMFASADLRKGPVEFFSPEQPRRRALLAVGLNSHQRTSDEACQPSTIRSRPAGGPDPCGRIRPSRWSPPPWRQARRPPKPAAAKPAPAAAAHDGRRRHGGRRRLAARLRSAEWRHDPPLPAADRHLGQAEAHGGLQRRVLASQGADKPVAGHDQAGSRHQGGARRAPGQLPEPEDHRGQLPGRSRRSRSAKSSTQIDKAIPERRARHRARSRPRERRQEQDHAEDGRGHQGRSADDLLQQDTGGDRQPRRRADLEPDQGQRPEVRRQHQLGPVRARADQDLLPAQRRPAG